MRDVTSIETLKLDPCPKCGSPAQMRSNWVKGKGLLDGCNQIMYWVVCSNEECLSMPTEYSKWEYALCAWNAHCKAHGHITEKPGRK